MNNIFKVALLGLALSASQVTMAEGTAVECDVSNVAIGTAIDALGAEGGDCTATNVANGQEVTGSKTVTDVSEKITETKKVADDAIAVKSGLEKLLSIFF